MKLFGLTGGIGMGKSTAAAIMARRGVPVIDTDLLARELVEPEQPALAEVSRVFGAGVLDAEGRLRRDVLAGKVFANPLLRKKLEAILHPRIRERWLAQVAQWRAENQSAAVVVIPLLFETNARELFDAVICLACSAATQRERLLERGWTGEQIAQRLAAQWPSERKMAASDHVIWTEGAIEFQERQLERIFAIYFNAKLAA